MRLNPLFILICILFLYPRNSRAQGWAWARSAPYAYCESYGVAADRDGNVYGAGSQGGLLMDFGSGVTAPPGSTGQLVREKYNSTGTPLWAGSTIDGSTVLYKMATDSGRNLIIFGAFQSPRVIIGPDTLINPTPWVDSKYFLAKISPSGTVLWAIADGSGLPIGGAYGPMAILGPITIGVGGVTTDDTGNIYITSTSTSPTLNIGTRSFTGRGSSDIFLAKYSPSGALIWASAVGGSAAEYALDITVTPSGHSYICGDFLSPSIAVGPSVITNPYTHQRAYIAEFSSSGAPLWAEAAGGANYAFGCAIESDVQGNVYLTGGFGDSTITFGGVTTRRTYRPTFVGFLNMYLVRYSPSHTVTWTKTAGTMPDSHVFGYSLTVTPCGHVWVAGTYREPVNFDGHILPVVNDLTTTHPNDRIFLAGYDVAGGFIGCEGVTTGGDDEFLITSDPKGNVILCGDNYGMTTVLGRDTLEPVYFASDEAFMIAKYAISTVDDTVYRNTDTSFCDADSLTLHAPPSHTSYYWDNGSRDTIRNVAAGTYWLYSSSCNDTTFVDTFHVTTTPSDTTYRSKDTSVCINHAPVTFYAPAGHTSYLWNTGSSADSITVSIADTYFVASLSGCSMDVDSFRLTINPNDTAFHKKDTSACASVDSVRLKAPAGYSRYRWNTGDTTSSVSAGGTGIYIAYSTSGCNVRIDTFNVSFLTTPVVNIGNDTAVCAGHRIILTSPQPAGSSWHWNTGSTNDSITANYTAQYKLTVTNRYGCKASDSATITIYPYPVVDLGADTSLCDDPAHLLQSVVTYPSGLSYLWSTGSSSPSITATAPGLYWLSVDNHGCSGSDTIIVKGSGRTPDAPVAVNKDYCQFDVAAPLTASGTNLQWYTARTGGAASNNAPVPPTNKTGYYKWYVSQISDSGCESKRTEVIVYVDQLAKPVLTQSDSVLCKGTKVTFFANGAGSNMTGIKWDFGLGDTISGVNPVERSYDRKGVFTTTFSSSYKVCPGKTGSVRTIVLDGPAAVYLGEDTTICPGGAPIILNDYTNASNTAVSWRWNTGGTASSIQVTTPGTYFVKASIDGCYLTDTIQVFDDCYINLPNVFTPNGDGLNDYFFPRQLLSRGLTEFSMHIYNRWGQAVFTTTALDGRGWDGRFNGNAQPQGVFVYVIDAAFKDGQKEHYQGNVTLLR